MASYRNGTRWFSNTADTYWRVREPEGRQGWFLFGELRAAGYIIETTTKSAEVRLLKRHHDHGGLSYNKCSNDELAAFLQARRLVVDKTGLLSTWREKAMKELMAADATRTFHRFLDLSPEIRAPVYRYHFENFVNDVEVLHRPSLPPIARTCEVLKAESAPIFWSTISLIFSFDFDGCQPFRLSPWSKRYLDRLTDEDIGNIRNLDLQIGQKNVGRLAKAGFMCRLWYRVRIHFDVTVSAYTISKVPDLPFWAPGCPSRRGGQRLQAGSG